MIQEINRGDLYSGSLLGLAIGDALGAALEFKKRGTFDPIKDIIGGGPYDLKAGEWTDDTSMAMCLAESLLESDGFDAKDQMNRYLDWHENGYWSCRDFCFSISKTVREALMMYKKDKNTPFCGSKNPKIAGNDSLKRLAPIPLYYLNEPEKAIEYGIESSRTTNGAQECLDACCYFTHLMMGALSGENKGKLLTPSYSYIPDYWDNYALCDEVSAITTGSYKEKPEFFIKSNTSIVDSLEAALWAFHNSSNFKEGALMAANLGENSDTIAAIFGQLAGAYYGVDGLPDNWLRKLSYRKNIESVAEKLWRHSLH